MFKGLDTAASILVNNHLIGTTDNMFRKYILDLTNIPTQNNGKPFHICKISEAMKMKQNHFKKIMTVLIVSFSL